MAILCRGCLAEQGQEQFFRGLAESLQPSALFVTVRKAVEIMELAWLKRETIDPEDPIRGDMADCFQGLLARFCS